VPGKGRFVLFLTHGGYLWPNLEGRAAGNLRSLDETTLG